MARSRAFAPAALLVAMMAPWALAQEPPSRPSLDETTYQGVIDKGVAIEVEKMLQIWSGRLGTLIVADPSIAGIRIKLLQTDVTLTWGLFKKLLEFHGVVLEERQSGGRWVMVATRRGGDLARMMSTSTRILQPGESLPEREEIVTAILQVTHGTANDIFANLRGIQAVREQNRIGSMFYVRGPEVIVIVDFAASVEYYTKLVRALDVRAPGQVTRVLHVTFAPVEDVVQVVTGLLRSSTTHPAGVPQVAGSGQAPPNIIPDPRTNKLFVQCYADQLEEIQWMVKELDVKARTKETTRHFYSCRFADSIYLAQKLSEIFVTAGGGAPGAAARRAPSRNAKGPAPQAPVAITPSAPGPPPRDLSAIETRIVADERSNALIITADDNAYREILEVLQGKDGRPGLDRAARRIAIEVQVWEISTPTDTLAIGFELEGVQSPKRGELRPAAATSFGLSNTTFDAATNQLSRVPALGANGLLAAITKDRFDRLPVILQAIASLEKTRLVTTPFAVTNDNEEVTFKSGTSIAYVKNAYGTVGGGVPATAVDYVDATTDLDVKPQVHSDHSLTLEVTIALKSIAGAGGPGLPPPLDTRSYHGVVTVPNMKYVVFGGLESETSAWSEDKVPFLGDVPVLGHLFKRKQWSKSRARIYIFIRPTILGDDNQAWTRWSEELRDKAHVEAERDEWIPEIASEWIMRSPAHTLSDRLFEVLGTGSGCPFSTQPEGE